MAEKDYRYLLGSPEEGAAPEPGNRPDMSVLPMQEPGATKDYLKGLRQDKLVEDARKGRVDFTDEQYNNILSGYVGGATVTNEGFPGWTPNFDVARSHRPQNKAEKLLNYFPGSTVETVPDPRDPEKGVMMIRLKGEEQFRTLDNPELNFLDVAQGFGAFANEEVAASIGAAVLSRSAPLLTRMLSQVAAGSGGRVTREMLEEMRGYSSLGWDELLNEAGFIGLAGAVMEPLASVAGKGFRAARGQGGFDMPPEALRAQAFADAQGLPSLGLENLTPWARIWLNQSKFINNKAAKFAIQPAVNMYKVLRAKTEGMPQVGADSVSEGYAASLRDLLKSDVKGALPNVDQAQMARAVIEGQHIYREVSRTQAGKMYDDAIEASSGAIGLALHGAQEAGRVVLRGVRGKKVKPNEFEPPVMGSPAKRIPDEIINLQGNVKGELKDAIDDLLALDPNVFASKGTDSAFEQVKALRTRFYDLQTVTPGAKATNENRLAGDVYKALTDAMDNPIGEGVTPNVAGLWKDASNAWKIRSDNLAFSDFVRVAKFDDPYKLASMMGQPGHFTYLKFFEETAPEQFAVFREGFQTRLLENPLDIGTALRRFESQDKNSLNLLLSAPEKGAYLKFGKEAKRFETSAIKKALDDQTGIGLKASELVAGAGGNPTMLGNMVKQQGGWNSAFGENVTWGILENLINQSKRLVKGKDVLDPRVFGAGYDALERQGLFKILPKEQAAYFDNARKYMSFFDDSADVGTSIRAAGIIGGANPIRLEALTQTTSYINTLIGSWLTITSAGVTARVLGSNWAKRMVAGHGKKQAPAYVIRGLADAMGTAAESLNQGTAPKRPSPDEISRIRNSLSPPARAKVRAAVAAE